MRPCWVSMWRRSGGGAGGRMGGYQFTWDCSPGRKPMHGHTGWKPNTPRTGLGQAWTLRSTPCGHSKGAAQPRSSYCFGRRSGRASSLRLVHRSTTTLSSGPCAGPCYQTTCRRPGRFGGNLAQLGFLNGGTHALARLNSSACKARACWSKSSATYRLTKLNKVGV